PHLLTLESRRGPGRPKLALEIRQLIREMSLANPYGALLASMESSSSSASTSARPQSPSTWRGEDDLPRKAGERSSSTMPTGSPQSTSSWFLCALLHLGSWSRRSCSRAQLRCAGHAAANVAIIARRASLRYTLS